MEWDGSNGGVMGGRNGVTGSSEEEENNQNAELERGGSGGQGMGVMGNEMVLENVICSGVKVMTDEQMEILRKQISVYATICEQLVEMHKAFTAHQDSLPGVRMGNLYCDPSMTYGGHKITARQRWNPSPMQLQILESIFDQGNGTPSKQKIKEITSELSQHGQISETNVYNWFQNRRARSKRKQNGSLPNNAESEVETEVESRQEKKGKSEKVHAHDNPPRTIDDLSFQSTDVSSEVHYANLKLDNVQGAFSSEDSEKPSGSVSHMSFYDSVLSNPRIDHLMEKFEIPGSFNFSQKGESYDMIG